MILIDTSISRYHMFAVRMYVRELDEIVAGHWF